MLVLPLLAKMGWVQLAAPAFYPLGAALGGYVFGLAMSLAGGCAAGVWFKGGEGDGAGLAAVVGLVLGAAAAQEGPLRGLRETVQQVWSLPELRGATLGQLIGAEWLVYPLAALVLVWLARSRITAPPESWSWPKTGILMAAVAVAAWPLSALSGRLFGMAVIPGSVDLVEFVSTGGRSRLNWDLFFVAAIPVGSYVARRRRGQPSAEPISARELARALIGGALLGVSASLAAGCTVGHSLVGLPLLSMGSLVATVFIILGSWTVGWFELRALRSGSTTPAATPTQDTN